MYVAQECKGSILREEEKDFPYEHCWPYLKDTQKFGKMPTMNMGNSSFPTPIDLDEVETPTNEAKITPTSQARLFYMPLVSS